MFQKTLFLLFIFLIVCIPTIAQTVIPIAGEPFLSELAPISDWCTSDGFTGQVIWYDLRTRVTQRITDAGLLNDFLTMRAESSYRYNGSFSVINNRALLDNFFPPQAIPRYYFWLPTETGERVFGIFYFWQSTQEGTSGWYLKLFGSFLDLFRLGGSSCLDWNVKSMGESLQSLLEG